MRTVRVFLASAWLAVALALSACGSGEGSRDALSPELAARLQEAEARLAAGDPALAAVAYRAVLEASAPGSVAARSARSGLGRAEGTAGRMWAALWHFSRLAYEDSTDAEAHSALGLIAYQQDRFGDARTAFAQLATLRPLASNEQIAYADAARRGNQLALADSLFTVEIERATGDAQVWIVRGAVRRELGRLADAEADFSEALRMAPRRLLARVSRAEVLLDLGREEEAWSFAATLLEDVAPGSPADSARAFVLRSKAAVAAGDPAAARRHAEAAIARNPQSVDALQALVRAHRTAGDTQAARAAGRRHRETMRALENMGRAIATKELVQGAIALEAGDSTAALAAFRAALEESPEHLSSHSLLAPLARDLGRRDLARPSFVKLREAMNGAPPGPIFLETGKDLRRRGFSAVAAGQFDLAVSRMPGAEEPLYFAALARLECGDLAGADSVAAPLVAAPAEASAN